MNAHKRKLTDIRDTFAEIEKRTQAFLGAFELSVVFDQWLQLLLDTHDFAVSHMAREDHQTSRFLTAYSAIAPMILANAESARILLSKGLYGNALVPMRTLATEHDLLLDLHSAESLANWIELGQQGSPFKSKATKKLSGYFRDRAVQKRIQEAGHESMTEIVYSTFSEAAHGTSWAAQLFLPESPDNPGTFYLDALPFYDSTRTLLIGIVLLSLIPNSVASFFTACSQGLFEPLDPFPLLETRHKLLIQVTDRLLARIRPLMRVLEEAKAKLQAGEPFDVVYALERLPEAVTLTEDEMREMDRTLRPLL